MATFILYDINGQQHRIDTRDLGLFQKWFEGYLPLIQESSEKYRYPWKIEIYATEPGEMAGTGRVTESFTGDQLVQRLRSMATMIEKHINH